MLAGRQCANGRAIRGIELETGMNRRHLLERHPALSTWVGLQVKRRKLLLEQIHTDGTLRTRLSGPAAVHHESMATITSLLGGRFGRCLLGDIKYEKAQGLRPQGDKKWRHFTFQRLISF
jgi:hypothetical protein